MIIDRYLLREVAAPFVAISFALTTLYVTYSLTRYLTDATEGVLAAGAVFTLTLLKALIALEMLLPVALYVGLIVTLGRLYSDWEVTALKASGVSERRIVIPILLLATGIGLGIAALSLWARPWAYNELYQFQAEARAFDNLGALEAGRFHYDDKRDRVVFMDAREGRGELSGLFVRTREDGDIQVISATAGHFSAYASADRHRLELTNARVFRVGAEGRNLVGHFNVFTLWLPTAIPDPVGYKPKRMTTAELAASPAPDAQAELQWRQSTAVSALLLALLAVPLSRTQPRRGRYSKIMLAVVIYALYYNVLGVARTGVEQQATANLWWAPMLLAAVVVVAFLSGRRAR
jgi:lipopolysaccharide export system permease protein